MMLWYPRSGFATSLPLFRVRALSWDWLITIRDTLHNSDPSLPSRGLCAIFPPISLAQVYMCSPTMSPFTQGPPFSFHVPDTLCTPCLSHPSPSLLLPCCQGLTIPPIFPFSHARWKGRCPLQFFLPVWEINYSNSHKNRQNWEENWFVLEGINSCHQPALDSKVRYGPGFKLLKLLTSFMFSAYF